MATYAFRCESCSEEFEEKFAIPERPDFIENGCIDCGGTLRHFISWNGAARLRGRGWAKHPERETAIFKKGPQDPNVIKASRKEAGL
jgi:predicted nucleic acid-binding Zn ribbon protein